MKMFKKVRIFISTITANDSFRYSSWSLANIIVITIVFWGDTQINEVVLMSKFSFVLNNKVGTYVSNLACDGVW